MNEQYPDDESRSLRLPARVVLALHTCDGVLVKGARRRTHAEGQDCHGVEGSMGDDNPIVLQTAFLDTSRHGSPVLADEAHAGRAFLCTVPRLETCWVKMPQGHISLYSTTGWMVNVAVILLENRRQMYPGDAHGCKGSKEGPEKDTSMSRIGSKHCLLSNYSLRFANGDEGQRVQGQRLGNRSCRC